MSESDLQQSVGKKINHLEKSYQQLSRGKKKKKRERLLHLPVKSKIYCGKEEMSGDKD